MRFFIRKYAGARWRDSPHQKKGARDGRRSEELKLLELLLGNDRMQTRISMLSAEKPPNKSTPAPSLESKSGDKQSPPRQSVPRRTRPARLERRARRRLA
jgi:hypothetical protein